MTADKNKKCVTGITDQLKASNDHSDTLTTIILMLSTPARDFSARSPDKRGFRWKKSAFLVKKLLRLVQNYAPKTVRSLSRSFLVTYLKTAAYIRPCTFFNWSLLELSSRTFGESATRCLIFSSVSRWGEVCLLVYRLSFCHKTAFSFYPGVRSAIYREFCQNTPTGARMRSI